MKTLPVAVTTQMQAQQKRPALLFELGLSAATLYYIADKLGFTFAGTYYTPKAITLSNIQQSSEGQINRIDLNFDNVSRDMAAYAQYLPFDGRPLIIKRIYRDAISGSTFYNEIFHGSMEEITNINSFWLPVTASAGKALYERALLSEYQRSCRHIYGDVNCNIDGFSDLTSASNYAKGQVLSGGTGHLIINTTVGSVTGTNNDIFKYGNIKVGVSGVTYNRICTTWDSATSKATWRVGLPVSIDNTYRYEIYKGCPKDLDACTAAFTYGPISDNRINFGGFLHIGQDKFDKVDLGGKPESPQIYIPPPPPPSTGDDGGGGMSDGPNGDASGDHPSGVGQSGPGGTPGRGGIGDDPAAPNVGGQTDWGGAGTSDYTGDQISGTPGAGQGDYGGTESEGGTESTGSDDDAANAGM